MKLFRVALVAVLAGLVWVGTAAASSSVTVGTTTTTISAVSGLEVGTVDWTTGTVRVIGTGVASSGSDMQKKMMARLAAKTDAIRRLAECINGVKVDGETLMRDLQVVNDDVRTSVSGVVKNAVIVPNSETIEEGKDGSIGITLCMEAPLADLTAIILKARTSVTATVSSFEPVITTSISAASYSGLVVNVQSFAAYSPALDFCIYSSTGELLYGFARVSPKYASASNLATYISSVIDAKQRLQDRVGANPFQVYAAQLRPNRCDIEVSDADAIVIRQMTSVIKECRVAIVTPR